MSTKVYRFLGVLAALILIIVLAACSSNATATPSPNSAKPSNPGDTGPALALKGDATAGEAVFTANCVKCHGDQGKGGVDNAGSTDGTVPPLNPIDDTIYNADAKVFAANLDLFIEHGSTPEGTSPDKVMAAWGDQNLLTPQQIADVMAYVISLNKK